MSDFTSQFKLQIHYVLARGSSLFAGHLTLAQQSGALRADEREIRLGVLPPKLITNKENDRKTKSYPWSGMQSVQVRVILTENKKELDALFGDSSWPGRHKDEGIR